jgi:type II secretory pathway pseudopilin PulG
VIIIGILAMIGLPQFFRVAERGRAAEGVTALGALRSAELRYAAEHGKTTADTGLLDMQAQNLKFFGNPTAVGAIDPNTNPGAVIGSIQRNDADNSGFGGYTLSIAGNGTITCSGGANNICNVLGYAGGEGGGGAGGGGAGGGGEGGGGEGGGGEGGGGEGGGGE